MFQSPSILNSPRSQIKLLLTLRFSYSTVVALVSARYRAALRFYDRPLSKSSWRYNPCVPFESKKNVGEEKNERRLTRREREEPASKLAWPAVDGSREPVVGR